MTLQIESVNSACHKPATCVVEYNPSPAACGIRQHCELHIELRRQIFLERRQSLLVAFNDDDEHVSKFDRNIRNHSAI